MNRRKFIASLTAFAAVPFLPQVPVKKAADIAFPDATGNQLECHVIYMSPIYPRLSREQMRKIEQEIAAMYGIELEGEK